MKKSIFSNYSFHNYRHHDWEKLISFCSTYQIFSSNNFNLTPSYLKKLLTRPSYSPLEDLFLVKKETEIAALLNIWPELRIGRIILNIFVRPEHRRQGIATELLRLALKRGKKLGAGIVHICLSPADGGALSFLEKANFTLVRQFFKLDVDVNNLPLGRHSSSWLDVSNFKPGEEAWLARIQNRCFRDSWGFCPNTVEEIKYYLDLTGTELVDIISARLKNEGRIIGYCWPHLIGNRNFSSSKLRGRIHMLGVDPNFQDRGIGRFMLLKGLNYLKAQGVRRVELTADSQNKAAQFLYQSLGFRKTEVSLWFEKKLRTN